MGPRWLWRMPYGTCTAGSSVLLCKPLKLLLLLPMLLLRRRQPTTKQLQQLSLAVKLVGDLSLLMKFFDIVAYFSTRAICYDTSDVTEELCLITGMRYNSVTLKPLILQGLGVIKNPPKFQKVTLQS